MLTLTTYLTPVGWFVTGGAIALFLAFWLGVEVGQHLQRRHAESVRA